MSKNGTPTTEKSHTENRMTKIKLKSNPPYISCLDGKFHLHK